MSIQGADPMTTKVLLADDHKMVRDGLRALIKEQPDIQVVGEAGTGIETIENARKLNPQIIVMDIAMPDMNGIEAARNIKVQFPHMKIIALSVHHDKRYVSEMLRAGASGFLLKDCAFEELITAIREVMASRAYLSPKVAGEVVQDYVAHLKPGEHPVFSSLTAREREVLQRIAEGQSTKEIASSLDVSPKTVETFRHQIMDKLQMHTVAELTKYAIREGLTSLDK